MLQTNEMDLFIRYYANLYKQNPQLPITSDTVYNDLMSYNVPDNEFDKRVDDQIDSLEQSFKLAHNLKALVIPEQKDFLQIRKWSKADDKYVKMYLNIPEKYIGYISEKIFKFIDEKGFDCASKVSKIARSDAIVIRLTNQYASEEVLNFINNDPEIRQVARNTNPFLIKDGVVGIAYDDNLSYNTIVSECLANYFKFLKSQNMLENASINHFAIFMNKYYQDTFVNCSNLVNYTKGEMFSSLMAKPETFGVSIVNHEQVIRLFTSIVSGGANKESYYEFFKACDNSDLQSSIISKYDEIFANKLALSDDMENLLVRARTVIDKYIIYASNKYEGNVNAIVRSLEGYIDEKKDTFITRENGFRDLFKKFDRKIISKILGNYIDLYVNNVLRRQSEKAETEKYDYFCEACRATAAKYGYEQLYGALKCSLGGVFVNFTNGDKKYRDWLAQNINPDCVTKYCATYLAEMKYDVLNMNTVELLRTFANDLVTRVNEINNGYTA